MSTREQVRPVEVTTPVLFAFLVPYETFPGTRLQWGAKHWVMFTVADATRPFLTSNESLWATFESVLHQSWRTSVLQVV